jgi:hypothetical protein
MAARPSTRRVQRGHASGGAVVATLGRHAVRGEGPRRHGAAALHAAGARGGARRPGSDVRLLLLWAPASPSSRGVVRLAAAAARLPRRPAAGGGAKKGHAPGDADAAAGERSPRAGG